MARIVAKTWEWTGSDWKLVVEHIFYGDSHAEAERILQAHLQADAFLRGCTTGPGYQGITCQTEIKAFP